eukprot:gene17944-20798_t
MRPASIGGCFKLEFIDCSRNQIHELPEDMQYLVSLTHLDLTSNRIGHLPHYIGSCQALQYLDLSENVLAAIPTSFGQLRNLEYCNLENNSIISARGCLQSLENLKYLNFKRNALAELASDIGAMRSLTYLDMTLNHLTTLPLEIGLLQHIQELKMTRNRLERIPPEIGSCTALQKLDLSYNAITGCLPEQLSLTRTLRELDISFNDIDALPESIVGFHQLIHLNARHCRLSAFPKSFIHLDNLEVRAFGAAMTFTAVRCELTTTMSVCCVCCVCALNKTKQNETQPVSRCAQQPFHPIPHRITPRESLTSFEFVQQFVGAVAPDHCHDAILGRIEPRQKPIASVACGIRRNLGIGPNGRVARQSVDVFAGEMGTVTTGETCLGISLWLFAPRYAQFLVFHALDLQLCGTGLGGIRRLLLHGTLVVSRFLARITSAFAQYL